MKKPQKAGRKIRTIEQLAQAAAERKSVINCRRFPERLPAAVVMNMQALYVFEWLQEGMWLFKPKRRVDLSKPPRKWIPKWLRPSEPKPVLNLPYYPEL